MCLKTRILVCRVCFKLAQNLFRFVYNNGRSVCIKEIARLEQFENYQFLKEDPETHSFSFGFMRVRKIAKSYY